MREPEYKAYELKGLWARWRIFRSKGSSEFLYQLGR